MRCRRTIGPRWSCTTSRARRSPTSPLILGVDMAAVTQRVHRARLFVRKWLSAYFESAGVG